MAYPLLPYFGIDPVKYEYFPTRFQCFLYRNHEMITAKRAARVLATDEATVLRLGEEMGVAFTDEATEEVWRRRGYITLIRANWHLLTYEQLCLLLDWDKDYLAFILQEDDFLNVKLGRHKPKCETLTVRPLSDEEKRMTEAIRRVTKEVEAAVGTPALHPFDFAAIYPKAVPPAVESRFKASFCHSYCALYGDVFYDEALLEASFPDELLRAYAAMGIGGVWCQAILYSMIPCEYDPALSVGWEKRIKGLNALIERLARYGLRLYLYINEPREMNDGVFVKHPDLRGDVQNEGFSSLCLSVPEVADFFRESIRRLTELAPGLGGYITLTASENHTNCYSHKESGKTTCPRCRSKKRSDLYALVNRLIYEGATAADPSVSVIAYSWGWDQEEGGFEATVAGLPREVAVLAVSERGKEKMIGPVKAVAADYSISIMGPSEVTLGRWKTVRERGARIAAKVQLNNSWELCSVPYLPVFGHFYTAIRDLCQKADPDILMMTWTHGGFPSPVYAMVSRMTAKDAPMPSLDEMLLSLFPNAIPERLLPALRAFDDAFDNYPFSVSTMYVGSQHMGPALPLWREPTGYSACMIGPTYDKEADWRHPFPREVYGEAMETLTVGLKEGFSMLLAAYEGKTLTADDRLLLDCAEGMLLHFSSAYNHFLYVLGREAGEDLTPIVLAEEELALAEARLMGRNPTVGYEASNHYLFTRTDLFEKVLCCRQLLGRL